MNFLKYFKHVLVTLEVFDPCYTLSKLNNNKIIIYHFKKLDDYHYTFITHNKNIPSLKRLFKGIKINHKIGIVYTLIKNLLRISTVISIIFSLLLFSFLNQLIMDVKINGDSSSLVSIIDNKLKEKNINKYQIKKSNDDLLIIEKEISIELYDLIEWIEIKNQGLNVVVNFLKRRESFNIHNSKKAIYATKEGIIKSFNIEKGVTKVKINDYVGVGQLLIDGILIDSKGNNLFIGAIGSVYAYTWLNLSATCEVKNEDEASIYLLLLEEIHNKVDKELTGNDEYIEKEHILNFKVKNGIGTLNVHYTLVEDITR